MAKRKTGAAKRKAAGGSRSRSSARKASRGGARKTRKSTKTARRKTAARKTARKAGGRKTASRKTAGRKTARTARRATARRSATKRPRSAGAKKAVVARKAPALNRPRRTVSDEEPTPGLPSSLDLDRSASAVRTGRRELRERSGNLTQTSAALTGGDVDADWESAYSVGDEAPGGDNPTPDQDIVDDIGRAVGVQYEDNEELKGDEKISKRDRKRWELDPASAEDYNDRD